MHRWIVRHALFPLQEWAKGHPTLRILAEMEDADRLTATGIEQLRAAKLQNFVQYAYMHVPHIRRVMQDLRLDPGIIRTPADLVRFPLMRKADVRTYRAQLRSQAGKRFVPFSTGGSTGEPLLFDLTPERIASAVACRQRVMGWWGLSIGDKEFALWGSPVELTRQDPLRGLRDMLFATRLFSAFQMSEDMMSRYIDVLADGGVRTVFAYPSSIYLLCVHARKRKRNLRRAGIRAVFVTGEVLLPHQRELISETLCCPVANGYGGRDAGFVAHECPQGGMHIMSDVCIVEIVDLQGRPVPDGESGEIVVTDLASRDAPFLRYATGDVGALSRRRCGCGRPHPLLERIEGRTTDFLVAPDGAILHALSVIYIVREIEGVEQFCIRQKSVEHLHVQIVRNGNYRSGSEVRIREGLRKRLRFPVEVTVEYVPSLTSEKSGKFRHVVSDVPLVQTLQAAETTQTTC
jgi:phenylacetate-CoA ligase